MKFIGVVLVLCLISATEEKSTKKFKDDSSILNKKLVGKSKPSPPAIIAIEIVDPNENKTSKNSKRTIDSSLGYGYHSPPKYQVYKYSQHDIPPYRGPSQVFINSHQSHHQSGNLNQYYKPGTTLYSTVNRGEVGGLSYNLPQQTQGHEPHVPVIILRVFPSQLSDPSAVLHPNLPRSHPLAPVVNSIDIQALLAKYVQNVLVDQHQQQYHYQQPHQQQYHYQQPQHYQYHQYQHNDHGLLTHENYPKDTHTQVIFKTDDNKVRTSQRTETKTIQIAIPDHAYSSVHVETPEMQYGYSSPGADSGQGYYYEQGSNMGQNYYYSSAPSGSDSGYQQPEPQQQYLPPVQTNHAHQKRSRKTKVSRKKEFDDIPDIIKLDPIKA